MPDRPEIVCICGSTRFIDEMRAVNRDLTLAGAIVVAPGEADEMITDKQKTALNALHLRKIDLADRLLVVNPGGYIGESTSREIDYTHATGKPISFTEPAPLHRSSPGERPKIPGPTRTPVRCRSSEPPVSHPNGDRGTAMRADVT
ncbi:hypothetical protein [Streptomyces sp. AC154]|uniref:hypothetical protein n=1 Tax=Streptomyces sp. AC154 TaxID=3143184 RepID=UPI003F7F1163